jgi:hypothetical protein
MLFSGYVSFSLIRQGGGMAEWTIATVLKTVEPKGSVGSNPTPSALADDLGMLSAAVALICRDSGSGLMFLQVSL